MSFIYDILDDWISTPSPQVKIELPEILDAYFAKVRKEGGKKHTTVKKGEGLGVLAQRLGTTQEKLKEMNVDKLKTWGAVQGFNAGETIAYQDENESGGKVYFDKVQSATIGDEVYLVVKTQNFQNRKLKINICQGKEKVLAEKDKLISVTQNGSSISLIESTVGKSDDIVDAENKEDYKDWAVSKITLKPQGDEQLKKWEDAIGKTSDNKTYLYLLVDAHSGNTDYDKDLFVYYGNKNDEAESEHSNFTNYWLDVEGKWFGLSKVKWHDPVDNPICTIYMQSGGGGSLGKHWGLFGKTRNGSTHSGLDLFAKTGENIYACVDGTIYNRRWHGGYGNTVTIKVKDKASFITFRKDYKLIHPNEGEIEKGTGYNENGDIFLFYAHLDSVEEFKFGDEVKAGQILGKTGRSGVKAGTCAPHLHFEIFSNYKTAVGTKYRINPAFYVKYKSFDEQSTAEKELQKKEKERGKIKQVYGSKKLEYKDMTDFKK